MKKGIENSRTKAAAMANSTRGRSRVYEDKKKKKSKFNKRKELEDLNQ